jgi:predicted DNA-binding protein YlxM (UPF0122 family)
VIFKRATMATKKTYTLTEAARELGVSRQAVHQAIKRKLLNAKWEKISVPQRALVITSESLKAYEVSLRHQTAGKKITSA